MTNSQLLSISKPLLADLTLCPLDIDPSLFQIAWDGDEVAGGILNFIDVEGNATNGRLQPRSPRRGSQPWQTANS